MIGLVPLRWKIYGLVVLAFVLGLLRWRSVAVDAALAEAEAERNKRRLDAIEKAAEVRNEVEIMDDTGLSTRASKWLRNDPER